MSRSWCAYFGMALVVSSCAIDERRPGANGEGTESTPSDTAEENPPDGSELEPVTTDDGEGRGEPVGLSGVGDGGTRLEVDGANVGAAQCVDGSTESCGPPREEGVCQFGERTCTAGVWGDCVGSVSAGSRDCSSAEDNDCDGQPDNVVDDVCRCTVLSTQACDEHPGLDGSGQCRAGQQECVLGEGNLSSDWGACSGGVGPSTADSCTVAGDDADCDGIPNEGCGCIEGATVACGPDTDEGVCQRGTSTCRNGAFTACEGAVLPGRRNCDSALDNDCDGLADDTLDGSCACTIGDVQACGTHPDRDGNGPCRPGQQRCEAGAQGSISRFGACTGSVGPALRDSCTVAGDDADCNGTPNSGCQCIAGQGNAPCSGDANNSRCNAQGACVPCQANADCSLVSGGRIFCQAGSCVAARCGDAIVSAGEACDDGNTVNTDQCTNICRAAACGDGFVQAARGEECDDGARVPGDGCTPACEVAHAPLGATAFGGTHACMLQPNGEIICWGLNSNGQIGNRATSSALLGATRVADVADATQLSLGPANTCAVRRSGRLACWGLFFTPTPTDVSLTSVAQVAVASNQVCALHGTGRVSCAPSNAAFADMGLDAVTQIAAGNGQVCARRSDGTLRCWGSNNAGQLGTGQFTNPSPTPLLSIPTGVAEVVAGGEATCVRLLDGSAQCFGSGPLGSRTAAEVSSTPETVVNLQSPLRLASTSNGRCALLADQSVRCWGGGLLGAANDTVPVAIALPSRAVEIGAGSDLACAVLEDLSVHCWGPNLRVLGLTANAGGNQIPVELPVP